MKDSTLLQQLMDHLPDAVFFKDSRGRFLRINRTFAGWYGLSDPDEATGKSDADFYPKEFARATLETEQIILKTGIPILAQEEKVVGRDGKNRWVSTSKMPLLDGKGAVTGILGISRDIRNVKHAERKKIRIRIYKTPVYDSSGRAIGVQGVFSPIPIPSSP